MPLGAAAFLPQRRRMTDRAPEAARIRDWMNQVLAERGWRPANWAKAAGISATTISRAIKPDYAFVTSSRTLSKMAAAINGTAPDITSPQDDRIVPRFLHVRYAVQAGLWREMDNEAHDFIEPDAPVSPDRQYAEFPQWLEQVNGDSMDRHAEPGSLVHVVDAIEMGYAPRDGDFVIVERRRAQGALRERSLKQVEVKRGKVRFWPRSTNPRWSEPLALDDCTDDVEVEVVGYVIGNYKRWKR